MQVTMSRRRLEIFEQALEALIERYDRVLSFNPTNVVLKEARKEVEDLLKLVRQRLEPLDELEDFEI